MGPTTSELWPVRTSDGERPSIERASSTDSAFLAMDTGEVPHQFGAILILERSADFSLHRLRQMVSARVLAIPRLRQRLIKVPLGCGRPVWVDDPDFRIDDHVRAVSCRSPGNERALLDTVPPVIMEPLFRFLARLGASRLYMRHQHRFHTRLARSRPGRSGSARRPPDHRRHPGLRWRSRKYDRLLRGPVLRWRTHHRRDRRSRSWSRP